MTLQVYGLPRLPVDDCLEELRQALASNNSAVLVAPPGAGKTSRVPLALLDEPWNLGKRILVLEPRRLAARAAAEHMAALLGEKPGGSIGYRVRMDSRIGPSTRIEFITEGVFTRMILDDPELTDIGCVIFDEFHERNLEGDLGLALALDVQSSLREDLRLLPMSATLDGASVAGLLGDATVIESLGRSFPVDIRYRPREINSRIEDDMAKAIQQMLGAESGSILCFLPGQSEIRRTAERLEKLPANVDLHLLYGAISPQDQRAAITPPAEGRRKIVLATSIAQTSLTLEGVRVVIDSGLARVPRYEPSTGLTRLETVRASKAAINQRAGRAGRTQPGICLRLWHEGQTAALPEQERPEILEAELSNLVLDLAAWGVTDPASLNWLDEPPGPAWNIAKTSLVELGALEAGGSITTEGRLLRDMPLPPRLAHMVAKAAALGSAHSAARLALLIGERGVAGSGNDLSVRLEKLDTARDRASSQLKQSADAIARAVENDASRQPPEGAVAPGALLSLAYPDRIARKMGSDASGNAQYLLVNGRRAILDGLSELSKNEWLAVCEVQGSAASGRIMSAAPLGLDEILELHGKSIGTRRELTLDAADGRFKARSIRALGAITLASDPVKLSPDDDLPRMLADHFRRNGIDALFTNDRVAALKTRLAFLHSIFPDRFPAMDDEFLSAALEDWLLPMLPGVTRLQDITPEKVMEGLRLFVGYEKTAEMDRLAPASFTLPSGVSHKLDYGPQEVIVRARVQEFFSMVEHPRICEGKIPLTLELLSPAMRPIQKTQDIAGFWQGSWADVRKEMRGRYPKHPWPENPANEPPTTRAKPRG